MHRRILLAHLYCLHNENFQSLFIIPDCQYLSYFFITSLSSHDHIGDMNCLTNGSITSLDDKNIYPLVLYQVFSPVQFYQITKEIKTFEISNSLTLESGTDILYRHFKS